MPHFSLRDLFWLTLVAALSIGWWVAKQESAASKVGENLARSDAERLRDALRNAKVIDDLRLAIIRQKEEGGELSLSFILPPAVDWTLIGEPPEKSE